MTEPTPTPDGVTPEGTTAAAEPKPPTAEDVAKLQAALDKERELRKTYESAAKEAENARKASMTEAERAVAEAEERGRTVAVQSYGQRLARTEYVAEAAKRNSGFDVTSVLEDINLAKFIGEDGEPDSKAIAASVARLIPEANSGTPQPPSFDGGSRQSAPAGVSMTDLIRKAAGRA